eukprot:COSAG01_NODE_3805_length_5680_cov_7.949292_3_plen_692_part_00
MRGAEPLSPEAQGAAAAGRKRKASCLGRPKGWTRKRAAGGEEFAGAPAACRSGQKIHEACGYCMRHCTCTDSTQKRARHQRPAGIRPREHGDRRESLTLGRAALAAITAEERPAGQAAAEAVLRYDEGADAPPIPLTHPDARLQDVAKCFGFNAPKAASLEQSGTAGGYRRPHAALSAEEKARRFNALDTGADVISKIIDNQESTQLVADWHESRVHSISESAETNCVANACLLLDRLPRTSEGNSLLSALLVQSVPREQLRQETNVHSVRRVADCKKVFNTVVQSGTITVQANTRQRVPDDVVKFLVEWVCSDDNVQLLSWGKKFVTTDKGRERVPCLSRKRPKAAMWRAYKRVCVGQNKRYVKKSSFFVVVKAITGKQEKSIKAVDYLVAELVNQNRERLERLIRNCVGEAALKKTLVSELRAVMTFVKSSFKGRIGTSLCPSHDMRWALGVAGSDVSDGTVIDSESAAIFLWFEHQLKPKIPPQQHKLIDDAVQKVRIFMGHCVRTAVQQKHIEQALEKLKLDPTMAIVIADYKMKIEPSQHREPTTEHYGKRGISYHGVCVIYMDKTSDGEYIQTLRYFDTVLDGDASQDIGATLSIIEDVLLRMRNTLPDHITDLIFQSDNARTYREKHPVCQSVRQPVTVSACGCIAELLAPCAREPRTSPTPWQAMFCRRLSPPPHPAHRDTGR